MSLDHRYGLVTGHPVTGHPVTGSPAKSHTLPGEKGISRPASDADRHAFEKALSGRADDMSQLGTDPLVPSPLFSFPGEGYPAQVPASPAPACRAPDLARYLGQFVQRMLVCGHGAAGRQCVRIDLKGRFLPGVSLSVFEDEGRLVVDFLYTEPASGTRLFACARALACELAESLSRPMLLRVTNDGPANSLPLEVSADPPLSGPARVVRGAFP